MRLVGLVLGTMCCAATGISADLKLVGNFGYTTQSANTTAVVTADRVENRTTSGRSGTIQLELWAFAAAYGGGATPGYRLAAYSLGQLAGGQIFTGISSGILQMTAPPDGTWYVSLLLTEYTGASGNNGYTLRDYGNFSNLLVIGGARALVVTSSNDSGPGTLRQAIIDASSAGDTITFAAGISTINLTSGELRIDKNLTIVGPSGPNLVTVQRSAAIGFRIFHVGSAGATVSLSGLKIADGSSPSRQNGGGIRNIGALTVTRCTISGHVAASPLGGDLNGGYAGGVDNLGVLTMADSTVSGNSAVYYAGGIRNSGRMTITNCTISGNSAGSRGGGDGGGILNTGTLTIVNCTISHNTAVSPFGGAKGGGIAGSGTATISNTLIALNTSTSGPDVAGQLSSENFNLIGNGGGATIVAKSADIIGTAASPIDPLLGPLQANGGPTFTRALLAGSPAIDAGDDAVLGAPLNLATDQRGAGFPRKNGAKVDIGAMESGPAASTSRLVNLSVRTTAGTDAQTLIVGFVVGGSGSASTLPVLVRGTGPALSGFGVSGVLSDPVLTLFRSGTMLNLNDNWGGNAAQVSSIGAAVGAFALTNTGSLDAALYNSGIAGGSYTAQLTGNGGAVGIALAEIYDAAAAADRGPMRLINVSARSHVGTGGDILITGFVISEGGPKKVLIRAIGPSLTQFGVQGVLADPVLNLYNSAGVVIAMNDDWGGGPLLSTAYTDVGAFVLSGTSRDAALLVSLQPGLYTAQVSGASESTGVALAEVYEVP